MKREVGRLVEWQSLPAVAQFALVVLAEHRKSKPVAPSLARVCRAVVGESRLRPPASEFGASEFLRRHFRAVMQNLPLASWYIVLESFSRERLPVTDLERNNALRLSACWRDLESSERDVRRAAIGTTVEFLAKAMSWSLVAKHELENTVIHTVRISPNTINLPPIVPIFFSLLRESSAVEAQNYSLHLQSVSERAQAGR